MKNEKINARDIPRKRKRLEREKKLNDGTNKNPQEECDIFLKKKGSTKKTGDFVFDESD